MATPELTVPVSSTESTKEIQGESSPDVLTAAESLATQTTEDVMRPTPEQAVLPASYESTKEIQEKSSPEVLTAAESQATQVTEDVMRPTPHLAVLPASYESTEEMQGESSPDNVSTASESVEIQMVEEGGELANATAEVPTLNQTALPPMPNSPELCTVLSQSCVIPDTSNPGVADSGVTSPNVHQGVISPSPRTPTAKLTPSCVTSPGFHQGFCSPFQSAPTVQPTVSRVGVPTQQLSPDHGRRAGFTDRHLALITEMWCVEIENNNIPSTPHVRQALWENDDLKDLRGFSIKQIVDRIRYFSKKSRITKKSK